MRYVTDDIPSRWYNELMRSLTDENHEISNRWDILHKKYLTNEIFNR